MLDLTTVLAGADGFDDAGMLCTVSEDGSLRLWRTGTDREGGGEYVLVRCTEIGARCCAMARGFEASLKHGELSETVELQGRKIRKVDYK